MPCITWGEPGEDYFENPVVTQSQFRETIKLCNNFLHIQDKDDKITIKDVEEFLEDEPDGNEVWLLHRMQNNLLPMMRKATLKKHVQQGIPIPYGMRYVLPFPPKYLQAFEAVLFISASISKGGLYVDADVLARDPWADTALCAYWADKRLRAASEALGGATELRITATEADTPLQRELKALGYFCFDWDKQSGEYHFSKILTLRSRKDALAPPQREVQQQEKILDNSSSIHCSLVDREQCQAYSDLRFVPFLSLQGVFHEDRKEGQQECFRSRLSQESS